MNTKITLTNPTDDELSAAVAEHVAGLTISFGCIVSWRQLPNGEPEEVQDGPIPNYATSADAVLPLLEKCRHWKAQQWEPNVVWVDLDAPDYGDGVNTTFPRAACIALLRANGVDIIT